MSATMSEPMPEIMPVEARLSDLDLAALLCSRVCHDVISPVGAIANGLELIDDPEMDAETKETALDMVRSSAKHGVRQAQVLPHRLRCRGLGRRAHRHGRGGRNRQGLRRRGKGEARLAGAAREPPEAAGEARAQHAADGHGGHSARRRRHGELSMATRSRRAPWAIAPRCRRPSRRFSTARPNSPRSMPAWCSPIMPSSWRASAGLTLTMAMDGADVLVKAAA